MDAQQFLLEFGHIANAPTGVEMLRKLALHLAVSGDLVKTNNPVDASPLLDAVAHQKRTHSDKKKVIPKQASISRDAINAPAHWAVCRLGDIALTITGGGTPSRNRPDYWGGDIPWASVKDLKDFKYLDRTEEHISEEALKDSASNLIPPGRIIVCTRMGLGKVAVNRVSLAINQDLKALELPSQVNSDFFRILYKTREVKGTGMTVAGIKQHQLLALPVALPPLEEQSLIVAKVDELMTLCDQLERQQQDLRELQVTSRQSTMQALADAGSAREVQDSWQRLQKNFAYLFREPVDVRDLKGLILDLAVKGVLLPTSNIPTPASELIEEITLSRNEWAKRAETQEKKEAASVLKKLRTQRVALPGEKLPEHWCWASLLQVSQAVVDCHNKTAPYVKEGIHLVRTTDIRDGVMDLSKTRKISEETYAYWARRMPPKEGDIIFTREAPMGEAAIVPHGARVCLGQRTMLIRLFPGLFSSRFLLYVIRSPSFQARMGEAAIGMTVKHLRVGDVEDLLIPVPPRTEQDQIVEIVDRLFELCEQYSERLGKGLRVATDLATATVAALTGIAIDAVEDPTVKPPKTELIAPLRLGTAPGVKAQAPLATLLARHSGEMSAQDLWQRFGGEIDAFYAQLKAEVAHGWIAEPTVAEMRKSSSETAEV